MQEPFVSLDDVKRLLRLMPSSLIECCIYSQDEVTDVCKEFIADQSLRRFAYLELGFNRVYQPY